MARTTTTASASRPATPGWLVTTTGLLLLAVEIAVLPGAASPFRTVKDTLALGGLAALVGTAVVVMLAGGRLRLPGGRLPVVLALYPLLVALSSVWSASPRHALLAAAAAGVWIAAILWIATLHDAERRRLIAWAVLGGGISAVVTVLQSAGIEVVSVPTVEEGGRLGIVGLAGNPSDVAMGCLFLLPLLLARRPWPRSPRLHWGLVTLLAAAAVLTRTLTGMVALAALLLVWGIHAGAHRRRALVAAVAAGLVLLVIASGAGNRAWWTAKQLASGDVYGALSARTEGWEAAVQMVATHPLLGVGAAQYTRAYYPSRVAWLEHHPTSSRRGGLATHFEWAHNDALQVAAELGLPGVVWLVALLVAIAVRHRRGDPLLPMAAAVTIPFALMHYPTHLAVGLVALALLVAEAAAETDAVDVEVRPRALAAGTAVAVVACAGWVVLWQAQRLRFTAWLGTTRQLVTVAERLEPGDRDQVLTMVEREAARRIQTTPAEAGRLWRVIGRSRLERGDAVGAESAYRTAWALAPHEDAEMGVGLALLAQGRRREAFAPLRRVTRTNPALLKLVPDARLRDQLRSSIRRDRR